MIENEPEIDTTDIDFDDINRNPKCINYRDECNVSDNEREAFQDNNYKLKNH